MENYDRRGFFLPFRRPDNGGELFRRRPTLRAELPESQTLDLSLENQAILDSDLVNEVIQENGQSQGTDNRQNSMLSQDIQTNSQSQVNHSGNSDVDVNVNVEVDTTAIAYALLCSMAAMGQMSPAEFDDAVSRLEGLAKRKEKKNKPMSKKTEPHGGGKGNADPPENGDKKQRNPKKKKFTASPSVVKMYDPNNRG
ncbi:hypothetical protein V1498_09210 [Peribacillus sp. SCS-26]|uniref:hypothetical protein n=1 Tax=Paraperibacillus marinus TaxID=3115295 RepID=UPI003905F02A